MLLIEKIRKSEIKVKIFLIFLIFGISSHAFSNITVIKDTGLTENAAPYVSNINLPDREKIIKAFDAQKSLLSIEKLKTKEKDLLYPVRSNFTVGKVIKHKIKNVYQNMPPIFIVGQDTKSKMWLKTNAKYLKRIKAVGIITNVSSAKEIKKTEQSTQLILVPASLDGLEEIINTDHYPVLVYKGWVLQ